jgi:hypothetical protein
MAAYGQSEALFATGTGFFVSDNGIIVTCAHVVEDTTRIAVVIDGKEYTAVLLAKDIRADLAVLQIEYNNPYHFKITDFNTVKLGDKIYVLGFPLSQYLGSDIRLTDGSVSARGGMASDQYSFQFSAPVQSGNSGGPVFNSNFEVIGVAASQLDNSIGAQNVNFGVKSEYINLLLGNIASGTGNVTTMDEAEEATVHILCYTTSTQNIPSVNIVNKTGSTVYWVYVSPSSSDTWGSNTLDLDELYSGDSLSVSLPSPDTYYDIMLIDKYGNVYTKLNLRLAQNQSIEFTSRDLGTSNTSSPVTIINRTGYTIYGIYLIPSSIASESELYAAMEIDYLGSGLLPNSGTLSITPPSYDIQYDIILIDIDGYLYYKSNQWLRQNQSIEFTMYDFYY